MRRTASDRCCCAPSYDAAFAPFIPIHVTRPPSAFCAPMKPVVSTWMTHGPPPRPRLPSSHPCMPFRMRQPMPLTPLLERRAACNAAAQLRQGGPRLKGAPRSLRRGPLSRKANPLALCDCYGQPGHGELGQGAHRIPRSAKAVADAARLRSNKRLRSQPADGERNLQRQRQARARCLADAQRLEELGGDLVRVVLESVSIDPRTPVAGTRRDRPCPSLRLFPQPIPLTCCRATHPRQPQHTRRNRRAKAKGEEVRVGAGAEVTLHISFFSSCGWQGRAHIS
eukprot:6186365-Pleurochrysis_carterae.AAC.3